MAKAAAASTLIVAPATAPVAVLRQVVRSIAPPVLESRGLAEAIRSLLPTSGLAVDVQLDLRPAPGAVETTAYHVVAEALTNIARHSRARHATLQAVTGDGRLSLSICDDGRGGARPHPGSGLERLVHRVEALDGTLTVTSPHGGPTEMRVVLPCAS